MISVFNMRWEQKSSIFSTMRLSLVWRSIWTSLCVYTNAFLHKRSYTEIHSLRRLLKVCVCLCVFVCVCTIHTYRSKICRFLYRGMFFSPRTVGNLAGLLRRLIKSQVHLPKSSQKNRKHFKCFNQREFNVGNWLHSVERSEEVKRGSEVIQR